MFLANGKVYHVFTKSIADYRIFSNESDYNRMKALILHYQNKDVGMRFSYKARLKQRGDDFIVPSISGGKVINVIAYCIMPTHLHFIFRQVEENGVSNFMGRILNSYTRYFNIKYKRKGPLWESRFKRVLVEADEQLLHLTRYIHLNPVTAYLVDSPEDWDGSSYQEYITPSRKRDKICQYNDFFNISPAQYRRFVKERISYQRQLAKIKGLMLD